MRVFSDLAMVILALAPAVSRLLNMHHLASFLMIRATKKTLSVVRGSAIVIPNVE